MHTVEMLYSHHKEYIYSEAIQKQWIHYAMISKIMWVDCAADLLKAKVFLLHIPNGSQYMIVRDTERKWTNSQRAKIVSAIAYNI